MDGLRELAVDNPLMAFTTLLLVSLTLPPLFERLRLPGLVGLLVAGVVLGPSVLGLLDPVDDIENLFADVGTRLGKLCGAASDHTRPCAHS